MMLMHFVIKKGNEIESMVVTEKAIAFLEINLETQQ